MLGSLTLFDWHILRIKYFESNWFSVLENIAFGPKRIFLSYLIWRSCAGIFQRYKFSFLTLLQNITEPLKFLEIQRLIIVIMQHDEIETVKFGPDDIRNKKKLAQNNVHKHLKVNQIKWIYTDIKVSITYLHNISSKYNEVNNCIKD